MKNSKNFEFLFIASLKKKMFILEIHKENEFIMMKESSCIIYATHILLLFTIAIKHVLLYYYFERNNENKPNKTKTLK